MMPVNNPVPHSIDSRCSLGELVVESPARARLFERLHIDYCCGGGQTLAEACAQAGIQLETVQVALQTLDEAQARVVDDEPIDWRTVETAQLCDHIAGVHHELLRREFPRLDSLISTVVRVHGAQDSTLINVQRAFTAIRSALEPHLTSEETELFPAIIAAEQGGPSVPEEIVAGHEYEHGQIGAMLVELRTLCRDYDPRLARCNTHRAMFEGLEDLELDLHQHVHEENNILFARARRAGLQPGDTPRVSVSEGEPGAETAQTLLPACCSGWVAAQGQRWSTAQRT